MDAVKFVIHTIRLFIRLLLWLTGKFTRTPKENALPENQERENFCSSQPNHTEHYHTRNRTQH